MNTDNGITVRSKHRKHEQSTDFPDRKIVYSKIESSKMLLPQIRVPAHQLKVTLPARQMRKFPRQRRQTVEGLTQMTGGDSTAGLINSGTQTVTDLSGSLKLL